MEFDSQEAKQKLLTTTTNVKNTDKKKERKNSDRTKHVLQNFFNKTTSIILTDRRPSLAVGLSFLPIGLFRKYLLLDLSRLVETDAELKSCN